MIEKTEGWWNCKKRVNFKMISNKTNNNQKNINQI